MTAPALPAVIPRLDTTTVLAHGEHRGFTWAVTTGPGLGFRCAYLVVPTDHPWHGLGTDDLGRCEVHGGVAYAGGDAERWAIGFDTGHGTDVPDVAIAAPEHRRFATELAAAHALGSGAGNGPLDTPYMIGECERLAEQAARDATLGRQLLERLNAQLAALRRR